MLANEPEEQLLVFVHGFGGDPLKTWSDFHSYLTLDKQFKGFDLLFYHYDSKKVQASASAILLDLLMEEILEQPAFFSGYFFRDEDLKYSIRPEGFKYKKIFFVAHSFGAIVSRKAMLSSRSKNHTWHKISKLMLIAPAHNGAKALLPVQQMLSVIPFVVGWKRFRTPTLDDVDLSSPNCRLKELKEETKMIQAGSEGEFTIAGQVIWSLEDYVVNNEEYLKDAEPIIEDYQDHKHVCKPNDGYLTPLDTLKKFVLQYGS
ncbi:hypothetical protein J3L21_11100 [Mucilaginibacter rubeus]|nr:MULTISPECIES: hypothetical protein [Mucilaginibacter]QTE45867.1 hypothetical protein J3L19_11130 [Mucilaginibacter rubeus]QTE52464.1 hypothetical protein J3L21_11100 [Mucilaginibacter rubeus]QTE57553.1 hypothetical protein J3L23_02775 [Mucilaginibacter rubeus]QTF61744.1 hypothetical protein J3L20_30710 [Mucilaginibacter rubeus]